MTGRVFLHIGPPKTATTALQIALEALSAPSFKYLGVLQPRRVRNSDSLAHKLNAGLFNDELMFSLVADLKKLTDEGKVVALSEEILTLQENSVTTAEKIEMLGKVFTGTPMTVLITLRDPIDAIPSLYQQLYDGLPVYERLKFSLFCNSSRVDCYDYKRIESKLRENGLNDVRWVNFQSIKEGTLTTSDIFGDYDIWSDEILSIKQANVSQKSNDSGARMLNEVTMRSIGSIPIVGKLIRLSGLSGTRFSKYISNLLGGISLQKPKHLKVNFPNSRTKALHSGYLEILEATENTLSSRADESHGL